MQQFQVTFPQFLFNVARNSNIERAHCYNFRLFVAFQIHLVVINFFACSLYKEHHTLSSIKGSNGLVFGKTEPRSSQKKMQVNVHWKKNKTKCTWHVGPNNGPMQWTCFLGPLFCCGLDRGGGLRKR